MPTFIENLINRHFNCLLIFCASMGKIGKTRHLALKSEHINMFVPVDTVSMKGEKPE